MDLEGVEKELTPPPGGVFELGLLLLAPPGVPISLLAASSLKPLTVIWRESSETLTTRSELD